MSELRACAVIPAYNEERHVAEVVRAVLEQGVEALVVDDRSSDGTSERAKAAGARVVRHEENLGNGAALATGLAWAGENGYDAAVTLDGDGQHDPAEIGKFLEAARSGADIVVGSRMSSARRSAKSGPRRCPHQAAKSGPRRCPHHAANSEMPPARKFTNWGMSAILSFVAGRRLTDTQSGYRLIRTDAWRRLALSTSRFDTESEMLVRACRLGMRVREVPIRTIYGDEKSAIRPLRDTLRWFRLILRLAATRKRRPVGS